MNLGNYHFNSTKLKLRDSNEYKGNKSREEVKISPLPSRYLNSPTNYNFSKDVYNFKILSNNQNNKIENKRDLSENKWRFNQTLGFNDKSSYSLKDLIYQQKEGEHSVHSRISKIQRESDYYINLGASLSVSPTNNFNKDFKLLPLNLKKGKKTLILDLDETLVHSAFKPNHIRSDITLRVELDRKMHTIHVLKRPGVDQFLERLSKHYEIAIFTASLSPYANPLIDQLDPKRRVSHRLFREHCTSSNGMFIKDMKKLGRDLKDVIIIDVFIF
jgi:Dullard-like phosphatase family protein